MTDDDTSGALGANELNKVLQDLGMHVDPAALSQAIELLDKGIDTTQNVMTLNLFSTRRRERGVVFR